MSNSLHSLLPSAVIAFDVALEQTLESIAVALPDGSARLLYLQNVNNNYTVYDEASDTYYNYSLNKRPNDGAELYDMNAQRRLISIDAHAQDTRLITDTVAQVSVQLDVDRAGQAALLDPTTGELIAGLRIETRLG
jgi:hypothetical protein